MGIALVPREVMSQALAETNRAMTLIEDALKRNHFQIVEDGGKFLRIMPEKWQDSPISQYLSRICPMHSTQKVNTSEDLVPGAINFCNVDINEVLKIYAEFRRRNVLRPLILPGIVSLRSQTPLTSEEVIYALNVVLALNGIAAVDDGQKFVQAVPVFHVDQVKLNAPEADQNAALIKPEAVPRFSPGPLPGPRLPVSVQSHSSTSTLDGLAAYYATLVDSKYIPDPMYGKQAAMFKITFPVTKSELLYAIETTFHLEGLTISKASDGAFTVQPIQKH
jgi:hypothetical protein